MKKSLIALAALATVSGATMAQVTLSGVLDVGVTYTSQPAGGAAKTSVGRGNNNRLIFAASEDLGGGLSAVGNAQMRFEPHLGVSEVNGARPLFQGETRVGLRHSGFGTVLLGRGLTALSGPNGAADPFGVTTVGALPYGAGFTTDYAAGNEGRIDTGIFYVSPNISGFTVGGTISPRKITGTASGTSKQMYSVHVGYAAGPILLGLGNERNRGGDSMLHLYGTYDLGVAKVFGSTAKIKGGTQAERDAGLGTASGAVAALGASPGGSGIVAVNGEISNHLIGATVPLGATTLRMGYARWNGNGSATAAGESKVAFGVKHDLSKRTFLYSNIASTTRKNNSGAAFGVGQSNTGKGKNNQMDLGVGHSF